MFILEFHLHAGLLVTLWNEIFCTNYNFMSCNFILGKLPTLIINHTHRYFFVGTIQLKMSIQLNLAIQCTFCRHVVLVLCKVPHKDFFSLSAYANRAVSVAQNLHLTEMFWLSFIFVADGE